jgi:hypothetical protein
VRRRSGWQVGTILALLAPLLGGCVVAGGTGNGSGGGFVFLLLPLAFFVAVLALASAGRRRRASATRADGSDEPDPQLIRAELSVLADDILRLEPRVALCEAARNDYEAATHRYRVAQAAVDHADDPVDLRRVQRVVDEATWSMARARATLEGRPPPEPSRPLRQPGLGGEPAVGVERGEPVYVGSPATFSSGWFGGGGLFGNLLLGSMLGGFGGWMVSESTDDERFVDGDEGYLDEE